MARDRWIQVEGLMADIRWRDRWVEIVPKAGRDMEKTKGCTPWNLIRELGGEMEQQWEGRWVSEKERGGSENCEGVGIERVVEGEGFG